MEHFRHALEVFSRGRVSQHLTVIENHRAYTGKNIAAIIGHRRVLHFPILSSATVSRPMNLLLMCDNLRSCVSEYITCSPETFLKGVLSVPGQLTGRHN